MNIFQNTERAVKPIKCIAKTYEGNDRISDAVETNKALKMYEEKEKAKREECERNLINKKKEQSERVKGVIQKSIADGKIIPTMNNIGALSKNAVFKDIMFDVFYKSLLLDDDFKKTNKAQLRSLTDGYIDNNNGIKLLENAINESNSMLLIKIKEICEEMAHTISRRKLQECNSNSSTVDTIDFNMNDEEIDTLNYKKSNIDFDQIAELVKNKVLTVVRDEKTRQEEDAEVIEDIESEVKSIVDNEDVSTEEAYSKVIIQKPSTESSTLFNALFRSTYRDFVAENVAISNSTHQLNMDNKEMSRNYDTETEIDDISCDSADSEKEPDEDFDDIQLDTDIMTENGTELDMDLILAETITKYTLMEMLYTLKLENYTYENIQRLTDKLLNPVIESATVPTMESNSNYIDLRAKFFKQVNNIKNLKNIDKSKSEIEKLQNSLKTSDEKKYFKSFVETAIKEFETVKEKNPKLAKSYDDHIEWFEGLK